MVSLKSSMKLFFDLIGDHLLDSYNEAFDKGKMSISQRRGIFSLIPKGESYLVELTNWRPITLLNVDYKVLARAFAKRIELKLPKLIHSDQTGFVKGRFIGQNVRLLNDIMEYTELNKIPGIMVLIDFEKAFDTLEWHFLQNTLKYFSLYGTTKISQSKKNLCIGKNGESVGYTLYKTFLRILANIYLMKNSRPNTTLKSISFTIAKFSLQFPKILNSKL